MPNVRVAEEAVSLMRATKALGLEPGVGGADKQYWANSTLERLHDDAIKEGFTPSTDYRIDRLGKQGGDHGALYIEGGTYCPATPEPLQNATKEQHRRHGNVPGAHQEPNSFLKPVRGCFQALLPFVSPLGQGNRSLRTLATSGSIRRPLATYSSATS